LSHPARLDAKIPENDAALATISSAMRSQDQRKDGPGLLIRSKKVDSGLAGPALMTRRFTPTELKLGRYVSSRLRFKGASL